MHFNDFRALCRSVARLYTAQRIPVAAAGLSFFLTMTFFPLLICLHSMLGSLFPATEELRGFLSVLLPQTTVAAILDYLRYVAANQSDTMVVMALTVVATSAAAAFRTIQRVIGEMRGRIRYTGVFALVVSFCFSLLFLAAIYFAVVLIVTGKWFLDFADRHIYSVNISDSWPWARFVLLFFLLFAIISGLYRITAPRGRSTRLLPGAVTASVSLAAVSVFFSAFIGASAKYPLLYGSLASVIVIMLWLYTCGIILFLGAGVNIALEQK